MVCNKLNEYKGNSKAEKIRSMIDVKFKEDFKKHKIPHLQKCQRFLDLEEELRKNQEEASKISRKIKTFEKEYNVRIENTSSYDISKKLFLVVSYDACLVPIKDLELLQKAKDLANLNYHKEANKIYEELIFKYKLLE